MNKQLKRKLGIVACSVVASIAVCYGATATEKVSAEGNVFENAQINMLVGASVRYYEESATTDQSGIRFSAIIDSTTYQALEDLESTEGVKVSYGMLIAPYEYFTACEFNEATVFGVNGDKKYTWDGDTAENASTYIKIAHVTYDKLAVSGQKGYENYHEVKGSLIKIKDENLTREFIGRAYIKYEYDGGVAYKFATYKNDEVANNIRSIVYVSQLAINAEDKAAAWLRENYVAKVEEMDTTYTLETYVGENLVKSEVVTGVKVNQKLENVATESYQGFNLVSAETSGTVYANGRLTLKHVYAEEENSAYQVKNGGFETGDLTDWTLTGDIGAVSSETHYWKGDSISEAGFAYGLDGTYMFSAYASGLERNMGTLQSSPFTVSESGWITYKLGGAKNNTYVYVDVVEAATGNILKRYSNQNHRYEVVGNVRLGCELNAYKANVQDLVGKEVYLRVSDFASGDFGLFFLDSVNTLHLAEPQGNYTLATEVAHQTTIYDLYNGNFSNDMDGWTTSANIGAISEATTYWAEAKPFYNEGKYFSCYADGQSEAAKGTLRSNVFQIGGSGYITYRLGGVKNPDQVYMEVIDAITGVKYGHFYNQNIYECALISYKANLSAWIGKLVYINFVDNATADYGLIFCDEFVTYYADGAEVPAYIEAVNKVESVYNVMNGGFETGNLLGWTLVSGEVPGRVTDIDYFWNDVNRVIGKDGNFSFTGVELNPENGNLEHLTGILRSNTFILKANSSISFKMGGSGADRTDVCLRIVNAETGEVVACYSNPNRNDATLIAYNYSINNETDKVCYVEIVDEATADWGLLGLDSINIYQA